MQYNDSAVISLLQVLPHSFLCELVQLQLVLLWKRLTRGKERERERVVIERKQVLTCSSSHWQKERKMMKDEQDESVDQ